MTNPKATMIWDGDCGFCRFWVERWGARLKDQADFLPSQSFENLPPGVTRDDVSNSVVLVESDGRVSKGAEAVFRALALDKKTNWPLFCYENVPGARLLTEGCYRAVAKNRPFFSKLTKIFFR